MSVPIGTIVAWHKNLTGCPALPAGWVECNGGTLDNPDSPYHGQTIPNLNGDKRFLRGSTVSGDLQQDAMQGHYHANKYQGISVSGSGTIVSIQTGAGVSNTTVQSPVTDGTNGTPRVANETRPINMSVVWILKVSDTERESRLIPVEDDDAHIDTTTQTPVDGGSSGKIGGVTCPAKLSQTYGTQAGAEYQGKRVLGMWRFGKMTYSQAGAITASDGLKLNLTNSFLTKRLGKAFDFDKATFYSYDQANEEWDALDAQVFELNRKSFAGPTTQAEGVQIWIKELESGTYVMLGVVQVD
ncbi:hypothetical protein LLH03_12355 [bacterium]|nr:hypothetical protein [bacterium]